MLNNCLFFLSPAHVRTNLNSPLPPRPGPKTFHRSRARGTARRFAPRPTPPPTSPLPPAKPSQISRAAAAAAAARERNPNQLAGNATPEGKGRRRAMPRLMPEDASLLLDHVVGDPSVPAAAANAALAALPFPSRPTPRLLRASLLRRLAADPVSAAALDSLQLLASLPSSPSPAAPAAAAAAAAHLAVAAYLAVSAPDFDAAAGGPLRAPRWPHAPRGRGGWGRRARLRRGRCRGGPARSRSGEFVHTIVGRPDRDGGAVLPCSPLPPSSLASPRRHPP
jgi:hypothetical protein